MPWYPEGGDGTPQPFPFTMQDVLDEMSRMKAEKKIAGECELCGATASLTLVDPTGSHYVKVGVVCTVCLTRRTILGRLL